MPVGSAIELYTSALGWIIYDAIWGLLLNTGLVLIPFVVVIVNELLEARKSRYKSVSATDLLGAIETRVYTMLFILVFAANPMIDVHLSKTHYTSFRCGVETSGDLTGNLKRFTQDHEFGDSGTTYDEAANDFVAMLDGKSPRTSLWWYIVTKLNQAIAQAGRQVLPCQADMRKISTGLSHLNIEDPQLRDEVKQFYNDCWRPAANKFARDKPKSNEIPTILRDTIYEDVSWAGSRFFIDKPGYYDNLVPSKALDPDYFPYMESRDSEVVPPGYSEGGGFPKCNAWWETDDDGLRDRLVDDLKSGGASAECKECFGAWFRYWATNWFQSSRDAEDALLRTSLASQVNDIQLDLKGREVSSGFWNMSADTSLSLASGMGLTKGLLTDSMKTQVIRDVAPIFQAIALLVFTVGLPIFICIGMYTPGTLLTLSLIQFSLIFWSFLFSLANWLDNFLLSGILSVSDKGTTMVGLAMNSAGSSGEPLLDMVAISYVVRACYILVPLLFSYFMGAVGVGAGNAIFGSVSNSAVNIGRSGGKAIGGVPFRR